MPDEYDELCERMECGMCDDHGMNGMYRCDHRDHRAAAKRGMELLRQTMGWKRDV